MPRFLNRFTLARKSMVHHCAHCGVAFTAVRSDQIYHSKACKVAAHRARKEDMEVMKALAAKFGLSVTKDSQKDGE